MFCYRNKNDLHNKTGTELEAVCQRKLDQRRLKMKEN